jgi:hypothetical protein
MLRRIRWHVSWEDDPRQIEIVNASL